MNYPAMRWVASEDCKVKGPGRALLWVIAYHSDRDTGECWVGQRRLARESGFARSTVQRALEELFGDGVLEFLEDSRGPRPEVFCIAPSLVEGAASATGVVEGQAGGSGLVEGASEVIHSAAAGGPAASPLDRPGAWLLDRSGDGSGPTVGHQGALVDRSAEVTGPTTSALSSENSSQGFKHGSELQVKNHVLDVAGSTADAAGNVEARLPPTASAAAQKWDAAVHAFDPDAEYDRIGSNVTADGWMLSDGHYLPARYAEQWVKRHQEEEARQETGGPP